MLWFLVNCLLACFFIPCFYSGCYVVITYMIIQSDIRQRNMIYFDWWRVTIVRDIITEVYWIYVNGLRFADFTTIVYTPFISWFKIWIRDEDVSSVTFVGVFRSVDRRVSICIIILLNNDYGHILIFYLCIYSW